jgi:hypothetical protein
MEEREDVVRIVRGSNSSDDVGKFPGAPRLFMLLKRESLAENKSPYEEGNSLPEKRLFPLGDLAMFISAGSENSRDAQCRSLSPNAAVSRTQAAASTSPFPCPPQFESHPRSG